MAMVVKNNMSAVSTLNTLNKNSSALQKSLAKVSSGMKINSAQDDASGYAISEKMRVQIRSLDQANQNTQNASSMMKTAEGAVSSTVEILKSLKEKAINAATDTNTDSDRVTIQKELDQFIDQIDDNALTTFNGKYMVDGSKSQQGVATYTSMTNQSLQSDTTGTTALTALKNRNNESLEIASTDYVTASFVKNGETYTTKFLVGTKNDLNSVFTKMTAEYQDKEDTTAGVNPPKAFGTVKLDWDTAADQDKIVENALNHLEGLSTSDLDSYLAGTGTMSDKTKQAFEVLKAATNGLTKTSDAVTAASGTMISEIGSQGITSFTGPLTKSNVSSQTTGYLTTPVQVTASVSIGSTASTNWTYTAADTTVSFTEAKGTAKVTYGSGTESGKTLADTDNDIATAIVNGAKTAADTAAGATTYVAGSVTTALNAAKTVGVSVTTTKNGAASDGSAAAAIGPTSTQTLTTTLANTGASTNSVDGLAKAILIDKIANNYTSETATLEKAKTGSLADSTDYVSSSAVVGTNASGDDVYTANGEVGLTIKAADTGIQSQISGVTISVADSDGNVKKSANAALDNFRTTIYAKNDSDRNELTFQVGAAANQSITVGLDDMRAEALGLKSSDGKRVSVATQDNANAAVAVFDNAIQKALDQQTTIGAVEARLDYTSQNLTTSSENTQAAESTIRDADMAKEMTNYTKNNVLLQAAQSMLAQANQSSSAVLSLLQ